MIGMLVLLMNLADLKISNLISGSIICQAAERQSENTETENNSGGTEKEKITQTEASTVSDILEELDLSRVQRMLDQMLGEESFSMKDMLDGLIKGEKVLSEDTVQEMVHSFLFSGLEKEKSLLIKILLLILLSAVLANFADAFESGGVLVSQQWQIPSVEQHQIAVSLVTTLLLWNFHVTHDVVRIQKQLAADGTLAFLS